MKGDGVCAEEEMAENGLEIACYGVMEKRAL